MPNAANHFDILIVGGGTAGITTAAQLRRQMPKFRIAIVEPSEKHFYQPLWTLVGAGIKSFAASERREEDLIPPGTTWLKDSVTTFAPEQNHLTTAAGHSYTYKYLIVCPGIQLDWQKITGLAENLGTKSICSNYSGMHVEKTWETIRNFTGGMAIFTLPNTPVKCAGAPQKIMYLAEHYFRKAGIREKCEVMFVSAGAGIFGVKKYADALNKIIAKRGIRTLYRHNLEAIDAVNKTATFRNLDSNDLKTIHFDMIHIAPPMSAPDFVKRSPLANEQGWVDVDKHSMRHQRYRNIFALGDASSLPTSKTGAAIRSQVPIMLEHLIADEKYETSTSSYNGYTSCPLVTGYGRLILAEFDYDAKPAETFPFDQSKERLSMYLLKKHGLPLLYWQGMMKGTV